MYGAVSGWFQKLAEFGATTLAGVFIAATLIRPELGSAQSPEAVFKLRLFALAPGTVFSLVSLFLVRFYSLTEERMQEIQRILKSRGEGSN
jgi:Na+/melibiose symporter-like transporter